MPRKKYETEQERQAAMAASRKKWNNANKKRYYKTFTINITPDEQTSQTELLKAHNYQTAGEFWRVCIKMLENNLIPDNPNTERPMTLAERNRARAAEMRAAKLQAQALTPDPTTDDEPPKA